MSKDPGHDTEIPPPRRRLTGLALAAGGVSPALAATETAPAAAQAPGALRPLDPAALRAAIDGLGTEATAAQLRISGSAGRWQGVSGVVNIHSGRPVRSDSKFRVGSVTRAFTAVIALQLVAEGRLDLSRPVADYKPGLLSPEHDAVTVGQLLNHTSGLRGDANAGGITLGDPEWELAHRFDTWDRERIVAMATRSGLKSTPGTAQQYNVNYILAGLVIEQVTGHTYAEELRARITGPLGLRDRTAPVSDPLIRGPHTHGYQTMTTAGKERLVDVTEWNQSMYVAEGNIVSTTADLDRFSTALFTGRLLPAAQQELLFTLPTLTVGQARCSTGLMAYPANGNLLWGKSGSRPGYVNGVFGTRDGQRVVVYSVNTTDMRLPGMPIVVQNVAKAAF